MSTQALGSVVHREDIELGVRLPRANTINLPRPDGYEEQPGHSNEDEIEEEAEEEAEEEKEQVLKSQFDD